MEVGGRPTFGGMEKAFSANIMMRLDEFFAGLTILDFFGRRAPQTTQQSRKRRKTCTRPGDRVWGLWEFLPSEILVSILLKLSIIDYFAFSGACRSWRFAATNFRKYYMEHQQPLVVVRPKKTRKACILYNMFDGKSFKAMLGDWCSRPFVGLSSGYLITMDKNMGFWCVNVMTRHELRFPALPENLGYIPVYSIRTVLFQLTRLSRVFMVLISTTLNYLLLSESGASSWQGYLLPNLSTGFSDIKIFDGKIFVLTRDGRFGEFNPSTDAVFKLYKINCFLLDMSLQFVTSDDRLCMILTHRPQSYTYDRYLVLWELDHKKMESVKIHDLGAKSLFMSRFNSALVDTSGWGAGNCVCLLEAAFFNRWSLFHLNGNKLATAPVVWDNPRWEPCFWYFANESCDISCVGDEFGL